MAPGVTKPYDSPEPAQAFTSVIEHTYKSLCIPPALSPLQVPGYLEKVIAHGARTLLQSEDSLPAIRADANSESWTHLRELMRPFVGWLYSAQAPVTIQELSESVQLPAITVLSILGSHLVNGEPSDVERSVSSLNNLVPVGIGIALALRRLDPAVITELLSVGTEPSALAADRANVGSDESAARVNAALCALLLKRLVSVGAEEPSNAGDLVDAAAVMYYGLCRAIREDQRLQLLQTIESLAGKRQIYATPLDTLISLDFSDLVVSSAALAMAQVLATFDDPMFGGVKLLAQRAHGFADAEDEAEERRAAAVLAGLLLLGDRRVIDLLGPCWRWLGKDGRKALSRLSTAWVYAAVIDWLLEWLEDCEGDEFGAVAGTLARFGRMAESTGVVEVKRAFPVWSAAERAVEIVEEWTRAEYAEHIRRQLLGLAARETTPEVLPHVLESWGIT